MRQTMVIHPIILGPLESLRARRCTWMRHDSTNIHALFIVSRSSGNALSGIINASDQVGIWYGEPHIHPHSLIFSTAGHKTGMLSIWVGMESNLVRPLRLYICKAHEDERKMRPFVHMRRQTTSCFYTFTTSQGIRSKVIAEATCPSIPRIITDGSPRHLVSLLPVANPLKGISQHPRMPSEVLENVKLGVVSFPFSLCCSRQV
ncbi:hypothetical protein ACRALDRAFT_209002 [Sodiomyces alcalophilus JCM 7366]|uniref:uncharacterized protein n=1 Tax=Sodiomyces alcalophilus JCM 7366 TaxID=591952 RepID=UPI0039B5A58F